MTFLATDDTQARQTAQTLALGPGVVSTATPATFEGAGDAALQGLGRGLSATGGALYAFGQKIQPYSPFGGLVSEEAFDTVGLGDAYRETDRTLRDAVTNAVESYRPDPNTTGGAGNLLYGVTSTLTPAVIGTAIGGPGVGAAAAGGSVGFGTYTDLIDEGVDQNTAQGAAAIEGVLTAGGVLLPGALPGRVLTRAGSGVAINVAAGGVERASMGAYLQANGYGEIAERYQALDAQAVAIDAVLGAAFGALPQGRAAPAAESRRPAAQDVDAALVLNSAKQAELDVAPGLPADAGSRVAHVRAVDTAVQQLLGGEPVAVDGIVREAQFVEKPAVPAGADDAAVIAALRDAGYEGIEAEIRGLENALAARGRPVEADTLPDLAAALREAPERAQRASSASVEDQAVAVIERAEALSVPRAVLGDVRPGRGAEFEARTVRGRFRLVDDEAPAGTDFSEFGQVRQVRAYDGDTQIGLLTYANDGTPPTIEVAESHRRRGVATAMLKLARQQGGVLGDAQTGIRGRGAEYRTEAGQAFRSAANEDLIELSPVRAGDALAGADEAVAQAQADGAGFQAAVNCFLRGG